MLENTPHVKNPLTIIAVFAGIAEVSGTVVTPFLLQAQQEIFVWFLVFFPILLVTYFFLTLNFNPKVLYAPSDYQNEDNFLKVHRYDVTSQKTVTENIVIENSLVRENTKILPSRDEIEEMAFLVQVSNFTNAHQFVSRLKSKGYQSSIYEASRGTSLFQNHESIWIGEEVEPRNVLTILKEAVAFYPHLKYMHLSGDGGTVPPEEIHHHMYIGGSTDTAILYGVKPFTREEIESLPETMSVPKLHEFIRSYYK